jgi:hypothetical protein
MFGALAFAFSILFVAIGIATVLFRARLSAYYSGRPGADGARWMFSRTYLAGVGFFAIALGVGAILVGITR